MIATLQSRSKHRRRDVAKARWFFRIDETLPWKEFSSEFQAKELLKEMADHPERYYGYQVKCVEDREGAEPAGEEEAEK
jgi:hypothetical protein